MSLEDPTKQYQLLLAETDQAMDRMAEAWQEIGELSTQITEALLQHESCLGLQLQQQESIRRAVSASLDFGILWQRGASVREQIIVEATERSDLRRLLVPHSN